MTRPVVITAMPCYRDVPAETVYSLMRLVAQSRGLVVDCLHTDHMYIDAARNGMVRAVLDGEGLPHVLGVQYDYRDVTHVLWLDSDQVWPADTVELLACWRMPVVGGITFGREYPHTPCAYQFTANGGGLPILDLPDTGPGGPLVEVGGTGMGCTLVEIDILRQMAKWFGDEHWFRSGEAGEDIHFSQRLAQMGVVWHLDCGVECGHQGRQWVTREHWETVRQAELVGATP